MIERLEDKRVGVLLGGPSGEREVSLETGKAVAEALAGRGYTVIEIDAGTDLVQRLVAEQIDLVFNALHGRWGEDGCVQGLLEWLRIPYTGAGVLASALSMDKVSAKGLFRQAGLPLAEDRVLSPAQASRVSTAAELGLSLPVVVKPSREGSSLGVTIVREEAALGSALEAAAGFEAPVLVEAFCEGGEFQVGILDQQALGVIEIVPAREFYDYEAKYADGAGTEYIYPARLDQAKGAEVAGVGLRAYQALGCEGYARVDTIVGPDGRVVLLEVNTLPGMTGHSLMPMIAKGEGIPFDGLCERILELARLKA